MTSTPRQEQDARREEYRAWTLQRIKEAQERRDANTPTQDVRPSIPQPQPRGGSRIRQPGATAAQVPAKKATGRIRARARETYVGVRGRSELREQRVKLVQELTAQGMSSTLIARQLGIASSTVRDYRSDPDRGLARARQAQLGVEGIAIQGTPVERVKRRWELGGPHKGRGSVHAAVRGKQLRAIVGYYAGRGR